MIKYPNNQKRITAIKSANEILHSTSQLFLISKREKKPHGCGVLITYNSKYYCLSNSHVLNREKFPEVFVLDDSYQPVLLEGGLMYSEKNLDPDYHSDNFDVGIMELTAQVAQKFIASGYTFLEFSKIETNVSLLRNSVTMIAAYPANKTKFNIKTKELKFNPQIIRTIPSIKDYSSLGFPIAFHHVIEYPRKSFRETSTGTKITAALPHGMSGSGLWILVGESEDYRPILIGILSEYHDNRSLIFSTKIDIYLSIIKQLFDTTLPYEGIVAKLEIN
jgi:hypothetical protein